MVKIMKKNKIEWCDPVGEIMKNSEVIKTISVKDVNKSFEDSRKRREKAEQEELEKYNSKIIICPLCKHENRFDKFHNAIKEDNGIMGDGYSSWSILEYNCCPKCGIMFKEIK